MRELGNRSLYGNLKRVPCAFWLVRPPDFVRGTAYIAQHSRGLATQNVRPGFVAATEEPLSKFAPGSQRPVFVVDVNATPKNPVSVKSRIPA